MNNSQHVVLIIRQLAVDLFEQIHDMITGYRAGDAIQRLDEKPDFFSQHIIGLHCKAAILNPAVQRYVVRYSQAAKPDKMGIDLIEYFGGFDGMLTPHRLAAQAGHNIFGHFHTGCQQPFSGFDMLGARNTLFHQL